MRTIFNEPLNLHKPSESLGEKTKNIKPGAFKKHFENGHDREISEKTSAVANSNSEEKELNTHCTDETADEENGIGQAPFQPLTPLSALTTFSTVQTQNVKPLSADVLLLFETMISELQMIDTQGIAQTTITYASKDPYTSPFHNTQIIVNEFKTAPKAFNIRIETSPQALAILQKNLPQLTATFEAGSYSFKINRFDLSLKKSYRQAQTNKVKTTIENDLIDNVEWQS